MGYKKDYKEIAKKKEQEAYKRIVNIAESFEQSKDKLAEFFEFGTKFYQYSPRNVMLMLSQNPNITYVDSFLAWKNRDASVKKGEKGINILVPVQITYIKDGKNDKWIKISDASEEEKQKAKAGLVETRKIQAFKIGNVFDISQTTFPKEEYPKIFFMGYTSEMHEKISEALKEYCVKEHSVQVNEGNVESISLRGFYRPADNSITLNEIMESTQKLSTLSHEIGHALLHKDSTKSSAQKEFEADAFSIMLSASFGIEIEETRKDHLSSCYKNFKAEINESDWFKTSLNSFSEVFTTFNEEIKAINSYVEKYIPKEELEEKKETVDEKNMDFYERKPIKVK